MKDLEDVFEELTEYTRKDIKNPICENYDYVPRQLTSAQIRSRATRQIRIRETRTKINETVKINDKFMFCHEMPSYKNSSVKSEMAGKIGTFLGIKDLYVKYTLTNELYKNGKPKIRELNMFTFLKYLRKISDDL